MTSGELNKEPKAANVRSVQWTPRKEFRGVKMSRFNSGSPFQGVTYTEQKPFIKLGGGKPLEMTQGEKLKGKISGDFNLRPQEQCVKTLQLPGPEVQKGGNFTSCSEPQSHCVETVSVHHGAGLENTKSPLGLQPKGNTATELQPSVQERDVKTSEDLMTRLKTEGKEPSGSTQACLSHRFKTFDKSMLPWKNPKCDPTLRSLITNKKLVTFKSRFHIEDRRFPKLAPGIQSRELKPFKSSPGTQQPQDVTFSVFKEEPRPLEAKSGVLGQGSEMKSEPQGQSTKCSDFTPETTSQNMKLKLTPRSPMKSKPISTKIQRVKLDVKPGPQSQNIKSDSILKTKPQEMEMEDCESGPQLQDLKSLRTIMGVKVQDVKSMSFSPRPHVESMPSEFITEKNVLGMKPAEMSLQGETPLVVTPRKLLSSTQSIGLDSGFNSQDLKYPELIMGMTLQGSSNLGVSTSQDMNSSNLMLGAKFQKIQIWKNQLGSRPQSNGVNSVVLPTSPPEDRKFPERSTHTPFCTNAVKLTPGSDLNDLRSKVFLKEPLSQNVQAIHLKPASQSQSVRSSKEPMIVLPPQSTRKLLAGPSLTSVKFSDLPLKSEQKNRKSLAFPSEPKWQGVKQAKLSSVCLQEIGKSVELPPKSIFQNVKPGNLMPQTIHPLTESMRPEREVEDFAEINMKHRCQVPKSVHFTSTPVSQDLGSLEFTNGVVHKSREMTGKSMWLSSKPTDNILESLEMPPKLVLQVPELFDLTPTLSDHDLKSSEPNLQKSYQLPEPPELHSWTWPQFQDFKKLQTKEGTESDRMTLSFKNHVADTIELTCEARHQGEEFRMTPKAISRKIGFIENSPRPCPQDLGPLGVGSKERSQREQSVITTRPFCPIPDTTSGITPGPGPQIPKSKNLASMVWLHKESFELAGKEKSQVVGKRDSVELTFGTQQSGGVAAKLTTPQNLSLENVSITPTESLDEMINVGISVKPRDQVTESVKTQLSVPHSVALPKVCEFVEVISRPPLQVAKSVMIPEKVAPGPCPQAVEPIGLGMRPSIRVKECLNLHPRPHLQDLVKPMELIQRADIQVTSAELISQQTSPLKEPTVSTHEQRLQAVKSLGLKTKSPKIKKIKDSNQGPVCQNKESEMIAPAKLDAENSLSRSIHSPSIPCPSIVDRTTELGHSQGSGVPEVSRAFGMENIGVGSLQSSKSYTDNTMKKSSVLPLVLQNLPSDKTGDSKGTRYPDIWSMNVLSKEESGKKKMEEFQRYSSYTFRLLSQEFQAGLVARRSTIHSFLGIQQNVWESHVCRQRLPRKYLSSMLMLGNVLGTTMERKPCSQPFSIERSSMDSCQSIENLFGVPAELMEFSQSLLERVPRTMSQTSVEKKYIQRHILFHSNEKKMPLKMWTRGSTSSIIQRFSGTRLGVRKPSSKPHDIFQEATEHVSVSCTGTWFPDLMRSEILYTREDSVSREQSKISPCAPSRTFESQHSLKTSSLSQSNTDNSEHLLRELKLKIAGKLIRSQIPHNVPPPLDSGLVLKYPICLECGRCSGLNCSHKLHSAWGPYLLIYPQLHLLNSPEGHGDVQLHLGFKLGYPQKGTGSPSHREARFSKLGSKHPGYGSNQDETWIKSSLRKTSVLTDPLKKIVKGPKTQNTRLYKISPRTLRGLSRNRIETPQTSTVSSKTQPEKSSQPKIIQPLVQGLRQAFQAAHRIVTFTGRKLKKMRPDKLCSVNNLCPKQNANDYFMRDSEGARTPAVRLRSTGSSAKQKDTCQGGSERGRQAPQPKPASSLPPRPLQSQKTMVRGRDDSKQATRVPKIMDNVYGDEAPKNQPQQLGFFRERTPCNKPSERSHCLLPQGTHWQNLSKRRHHSPSRRRRSSPSDRTLRSILERIYCNPSQRNSLSPSLRSVSERSQNSVFKWRSHSPSKSPQIGSRSPGIRSRRSSRNPLRSPHSPSGRSPHRHSVRSPCSPSGRNSHSPSRRSPHRRPCRPLERRHSSPSDRTLRHLLEQIYHTPSQINSLSSSIRSLSDRSHNGLFKGRGHSPSRRRPQSPSGESPSNPLRSPRIPSRRIPHSPSRRSPCRPLERRGCSPSVKKSLHSHFGRSQQSPSSLRCLSPSKKSHLILMRRSRGSPSVRSHGDFSERAFSIPSRWKRCSSGDVLYPNITWQQPGMPGQL
ncbi:uncharacterized protein C2orf16-like [Apodemus sylvaticus]|uniref:uncharacterized protein C2orf16-like n=1 Tax=Apodemus sylvaticus TaxID=10129 RepID=UPI00224350D3|nr:uncharacterized protein C2orf16-like [Apodemus sylvaticus]